MADESDESSSREQQQQKTWRQAHADRDIAGLCSPQMMICNLFVAVVLLGTFIACVAISHSDRIDDCSSGTDNRTHISYLYYLYVTGSLGLVSLAVILLAAALSSCYKSGGSNDVCTVFWYWLAIIVLFIVFVFMLIWFIVGSIVYFDDIIVNCASGGVLVGFGAYLFAFSVVTIFYGIAAACAGCGRGGGGGYSGFNSLSF